MTNKLDEKIAALRTEVEQIRFQSEEDKQHLEELLSELDQLEHQDDEQAQSITGNIKSAIERFEAEHPRATAILNDIMVTLSNMGI